MSISLMKEQKVFMTVKAFNRWIYECIKLYSIILAVF